jgi:phosphopantothenoylcysteine synthetase/decarboxylase
VVARLLLGCTGSIGVLGVPWLIIELRTTYRTEIQVLMTSSAQKFLTPYALEVLTGNAVAVDIFERRFENHISYLNSHDIFLIAPASANTISKIASGIADNIVSLCACVCLGSKSKLIIAPAMNPAMWNNPIVQDNVEKLKSKGAYFVGPSEGIEIANLQEGCTAMATTEAIIEKIFEVGGIP